MPALTNAECLRYHRHLILPEVGRAGQERLKAASVLLIGVGGLGSPAALYLAAAGVGRIGIVEDDVVDVSNIHRQILYADHDIGRQKVACAVARLRSTNSHIDIVPYQTRFNAENGLMIVAGYDLIIDGSDNFATRYLVNDACVLLKKPYVYGSALRFEGQVSVFDAVRGPCYRCLFPAPPPPELAPSCAEAGVLGVVPGIVGTLQAAEAIKLLLGAGDSLVGRFLKLDVLRGVFQEFTLSKDPDCSACGARPSITTLVEHAPVCADGDPAWEITPRELKARLDTGVSLCIVDVREPYEYEICRLPEAKLIPLRQLADRMHELSPEREMIIQCHHGIRSMHAVQLLRAAGFTQCKSLRGGIQAWAEEIDPSMTTY